MTKNVIRFIAMIIAISMLVGVFCSCGKTNTSSNSSEWVGEEVVDYEEIVDSNGQTVSDDNTASNGQQNNGNTQSDAAQNNSAQNNQATQSNVQNNGGATQNNVQNNGTTQNNTQNNGTTQNNAQNNGTTQNKPQNNGATQNNTQNNGATQSNVQNNNTTQNKPQNNGNTTQNNNTQNNGNTTQNNNSAATNSNNNQNTTPDVKPDASSADAFLASMPADLKGTTLKYFYWWDPTEQMEAEAIKEFCQKTGIKFVPEVGSYKTFQTELAAKISAGNSPDIVRLLSNAMYQVKTLQPITNSGYDFSDDIWWKKLMKDYTYNGKTYAVNIRPKDAAILDTYMIYYNKRALRSADLQDPYQIWKKNPSDWTWKKLWSMCEEFLAANNNKSGYYGISFQYNNAYVRMFGCANYDYNSKTGKWENYLDSPELAKRWSELISYNTKGLSAINHDAVSFQRAKILFDGAGPFAARNGDQTHQNLKDRGELGVVPLPTDTPYQVLYEYTAFGIPQGAKNARAVPYYLRYVLDKSSYDLDKVYYDAQAKDVVEYTLSFADDKYFFGENEIYDLRQALVNGTADQVKSTLSAYKGVIQDTVDSSNEQIKYLSK